jgi:hypothetical protein
MLKKNERGTKFKTEKNKLKTGKIVGLALAVLLLVATSVQADVIRATDTSFLGSNDVLVEVFTFTYDSTETGNGVAANWAITYGDAFSSFSGFGYDQTTSTLRGGGIQSLLTTWFESAPYDTFVGYWSDDISGLTVNGEAVGDVGNWFYNLAFDYGPLGDELTVNFGAMPAYKFVLYAVQTSSEVPEPATLAVIGLGLVGLGLARRKILKK